MSVLIVAEAGVNHNGDLGIAEELIETAAVAGADLIKFQSFAADRMVVRDAPLAAYQEAAGESDHFEMIQRLELDRADHERLVASCDSNGIGFFSSGFDVESVDMLAELGQQRFKIPSGEINNLPLLRHIGSFGCEVILSTGMAEMAEIRDALSVLQRAGTPRELVTVLHCTTDYPASFSDVNLTAMQAIGREFGVAVGYSDHTLGIEVSVAAVALGASVIEKHLTLDRELVGPDHRASLEPAEFDAMVRSIRNVELALGYSNKRPAESEMRNRVVARRSIVAARRICRGEVFDELNISAKRPGTGLSPMRWDDVVGRRATRDYDVDENIEI